MSYRLWRHFLQAGSLPPRRVHSFLFSNVELSSSGKLVHSCWSWHAIRAQGQTTINPFKVHTCMHSISREPKTITLAFLLGFLFFRSSPPLPLLCLRVMFWETCAMLFCPCVEFWPMSCCRLLERPPRGQPELTRNDGRLVRKDSQKCNSEPSFVSSTKPVLFKRRPRFNNVS